jgi:flagellar basal-body rod protein FlgB
MFDLISSNGLIQTMDKSMSLATRRLGMIASNLANLDTPGYRTKDFSFEEALKGALGQLDGKNMPMTRTHPLHMPPSSTLSLPPSKDPISPQYERNDGNDVSLDRESILLARTQQTYQLGASFAQTELRRIYQAIRDGKA